MMIVKPLLFLVAITILYSVYTIVRVYYILKDSKQIEDKSTVVSYTSHTISGIEYYNNKTYYNTMIMNSLLGSKELIGMIDINVEEDKHFIFNKAEVGVNVTASLRVFKDELKDEVFDY